MDVPDKDKKGVDDLVTRAIRAKRRFKALVRLVIANLYWLSEIEDAHLTRNVKKNVQVLTKRKGKKSLLTLAQKSILCKPAEERTLEEKQILYRIIGGLKCFRKYPENVKLRLAAVTYYVYYGPNRVIVRQNHEAHALYFIIEGEVAVTITSIDPVIKEPVVLNVGTMVAGSMFGEVSLLHDIPRTATITSTTPCEFLLLKKADFDIVLKASVEKSWDQIQHAMSRFSYFDGWDELAVRECCIYSKIVPYTRDQTILGDGEGTPTTAYFLLKGKCRIIEDLTTLVWRDKLGRKRYELIVPSDNEAEELFTHRNILDEGKGSFTSMESSSKNALMKRIRSSRASIARSRSSLPGGSRRQSSFRGSKLLSFQLARQKFMEGQEAGTSAPPEEEKPSVASGVGSQTKLLDLPQSKEGAEEASKPEAEKDGAASPPYRPPENIETHFMQVCIYSELACFGIGENMKRRRVVAMSDSVECLIIPRYWLYQHNKGNLWSRIQQYLDGQIPSTQKVFKEFIAQRKWLKYRNQLAQDIFKKPPVTAMYNVPYSIRIYEAIDFDGV